MKQPFFKYVALVAAVFLAGCTTKNQEAPPLSGPSEYGTSMSIAITPDVLTQDGVSQSLITVTAHDSNGQALRNVSFRVEIMLDGVRADFGSLSARNLVTGTDGRATAVYTAPIAPPVAVDSGTLIDIAVTPIGTDFNNSSIRTAAIRLVPPGIVVPPVGLTPNFTASPAAPLEGQPVLFDATASSSTPTNPIASYAWNFGDGGRGAGATTSHAYSAAGSYVATLTISDALGRSAQKSVNINVGAGLDPTAAFTLSPTEPAINQAVNFNASGSRPSPGQTIQGYAWSFGDGATGGGQSTSHAYSTAGTHVVTLTITDSSGHQGTTSQSVTVGGGAIPTAAFAVPPTNPTPNQAVNFNASASRGAAGTTIDNYTWTFGDGTSGQGQITSHAYASVGAYAVTLTVTDSAGHTGTVTQTLTVIAGASPTAAFTLSPSTPTPNQAVNFNASASQAAPGTIIQTYSWSFGDGASAVGLLTSHSYAAIGAYAVTLTVTDSAGHTGSTSQTVTVTSAANPTSSFTVSPTDPLASQQVNFNASASRPSPGATIQSYDWAFGDGTTGIGPTTTHAYATAGSYVATLTVTDTGGRTATSTQVVPVGGVTPIADFTISPTDPLFNTAVTFNGGNSHGVGGRTITTYEWAFGDGATFTSTTSAVATHPYAVAGTYVVTLKVTDTSLGTGTKSLSVTVKAVP